MQFVIWQQVEQRMRLLAFRGHVQFHKDHFVSAPEDQRAELCPPKRTILLTDEMTDLQSKPHTQGEPADCYRAIGG